MILADTTIWIDHFRVGDVEMRRQLEKRNIAIHPYIIAELALGTLRDRLTTLAWLDFLPRVPVAQTREVREMIEMRALYGRGIGLTDAHLLASCLLQPATLLWTKDRRLSAVASSLGVSVDFS